MHDLRQLSDRNRTGPTSDPHRNNRVLLPAMVFLVGGAVSYRFIARTACLTWGSSSEDVSRSMPGDDLLVAPEIVSTRAVTISAPASAIWPWLVQMGSRKGGVYTYDWIENLFGLHMHSVDVILPQYQDRKVGDTEQLGSHGPRLRVELLEPERAMVLRSDDGNWVWAFGLYPTDDGSTKLISRNRIAAPRASFATRAFTTFVMEPGSLIMERKMLLGIKQRAERLTKEDGAESANHRTSASAEPADGVSGEQVER